MKAFCALSAVVLLAASVRPQTATAQTLTTLYSFCSQYSSEFGCLDGNTPYSTLIQASDCNFYGTTYYGGANYGDASGNGTVFGISPSGVFTSLYTFGTNYADGSNPQVGVTQGSDGWLYGTTFNGGTNGYGTVYKMPLDGPGVGNMDTVMWQFGGWPPTDCGGAGDCDGAFPWCVMVENDAVLYGVDGGNLTCEDGDTFTSCGGLIWSINATGPPFQLQFVDAFSGGSNDDTYAPVAGLVLGSDGYLYGTGWKSPTTEDAYGSVLRVSTNGSGFQDLHNFSNGDGGFPLSVLVESNGWFFGTAANSTNGCGVVFKVSSNGDFAVLHAFTGPASGGPDGAIPSAGLIRGSDGFLYGTTSEGGTNGGGTVFRIDTGSGAAYTNLYEFDSSGNSDSPFSPQAGLLQGSDGYFYGTTVQGGAYYGQGTVFRLVVPLSPPPNQISAIQVVGTNVVISIPTIAGENYQLQYSSTMSTAVWFNVTGASVTKSLGGPITLTDIGGATNAQRFYRVGITTCTCE